MTNIVAGLGGVFILRFRPVLLRLRRDLRAVALRVSRNGRLVLLRIIDTIFLFECSFVNDVRPKKSERVASFADRFC